MSEMDVSTPPDGPGRAQPVPPSHLRWRSRAARVPRKGDGTQDAIET